MWQKFKIGLKCHHFPLYHCCNKKIITVSTWEQHYFCINIDKGGRGIFSVFLTFSHTIMSMIVVYIVYLLFLGHGIYKKVTAIEIYLQDWDGWRIYFFPQTPIRLIYFSPYPFPFTPYPENWSGCMCKQ